MDIQNRRPQTHEFLMKKEKRKKKERLALRVRPFDKVKFCKEENKKKREIYR
ncbi:Uncharacterized protein APZ42_031899 [Daphnia magna]|uniref:Uncharacterized protein n=1 Tax=Daphnia magna TaxID=35525 RepID=A0A164MCV6_9CRUS|nr:Uncharacterized protein APZ42_031899 [Daphnia magna]